MIASRAAPAARHLPGWLLVIAVLLIMRASAVGIEALHARYAVSLHAEVALAQVRAQANQVSATEWESRSIGALSRASGPTAKMRRLSRHRGDGEAGVRIAGAAVNIR